MPAIKPTLMEKIMLIRLREGWRGTDEAGPNFGIKGITLRSYESGTRKPSKFARLHLERCVEAYERGGVQALLAVAKEVEE